MGDDDNPKKSSLLTWLKGNVVFVLISLGLIAAAIFSVSYAYKKDQGNVAAADSVVALGQSQFEPKQEAAFAQDGSSSGQSDGPERKNASIPGDTPVTRPGSALGVAVDCLRLNKDETARLNSKLAKLKVPLTIEEVLNFNGLATDLYKSYESIVRSKGCDPTALLDNILQESGTNPLIESIL